MLLALLALVGLTVSIMFILWLTSRIFASQPSVPVVMEELGTGDGPLGGMQLDEPMMEELGRQDSEIQEPQLEEILASVSDAVATQQAMLDDPTLTDAALPGKGGSTGDGRNMGIGSGPGGYGRGRRWKMHFKKSTLEDYARQLNHFDIELGVLRRDNTIEYAFNLTKPRPDRRVGTTDAEKRYYLSWVRGGLQEADRELLRRAGIDPRGRPILKFLEPETEAQLLQMEKARAGNETVRSTEFGVLPDGSGRYKFNIVSQTYK
jgi:hypothetical protein